MRFLFVALVAARRWFGPLAPAPVVQPVRRPDFGSNPPSIWRPPRLEGALMQQRYLGGGGGGGFDPKSLLGPALLFAFFASGLAGFLFQGVFFLSVLAFLVPLVGFPLFQTWLSANLVEGTCPECGAPVQGIKGQESRCFS